jgi:glycosyltransferase involved in cell wall biosynthesis
VNSSDPSHDAALAASPPRPLRVLHLITTLDRAGAEVQLLDLCTALRARGRVAPTVAYLKGRGDLAPQFLARGIRVAFLDADGAGAYGGLLRARRLLREVRPDVVHTHLFKADLLGAFLVGGEADIALVSTKHSLDEPLLREPWRTLGRRAALRARRVLGISDAVTDHVTRALSLPTGHVRTLRYGLPPERAPRGDGAAFRVAHGIPAEAPLAVAPARWNREKGIDVLVEATALLRRSRPDAVVVLMGRGPEEAALRARAAALHLAGSLVFAGFMGDPGPAFMAADCIVLPSRREGFCLAALEALAAGRPVVASDVGGLPEVLGGLGRLVPADDIEALAAALAEALSPEAIAATRSGAAGVALRRRALEEFSMVPVAARHEEVYGLPAVKAPPLAVVAAPAPHATHAPAILEAPRRRRLLLVTRAGTGGAARHVLDLVTLLDRRRWEIHAAVSPLEDARFPEALAERGVEVTALPMEREARPIADLRSLHAVRDLLRREPWDLVHAHTSKPGFFARAVVRNGGPPVIYTPHGWSFAYSGSAATRLLYENVERRLVPYTAMLHCVADSEALLARTRLACPESRIRTIPNSVPEAPPRDEAAAAALRRSLGIGPGVVVVLMAARLASPKDPLAFLRWAAAPGFGAETVFLLAGGGPMLDEARRLAPPNVRVLGPRDDVPALLQIADAAVLATEYDACPYFLLEAASAGVPIAATDFAVPDGLATGATTWSPAGGDEAAIAALRPLLLGPESAARRAAQGEAAQAAWRTQFAPGPWIEAMEAMYEEVVRR